MFKRRLALSGRDHAQLQSHLLPHDGREAVAILLCSQGPSGDDLYVQQILKVPHAECSRRANHVTWPGSYVTQAQDQAEDEGLAMILVHSHPGGFFAFSHVDDESDASVVSAIVSGWCGALPPVVGTAVMVSGGAIRARVYAPDGTCRDIDQVRVAGDEILHWRPDGDCAPPVAMPFGSAMTAELAGRWACVVGVSGTGSIVAEQVARLGFAGMVLIDFDVVEPRNLNRILNSTMADAECQRPKVEMFAAAVGRSRPGVEVVAIQSDILTREAVIAASRCDVIFSCVDSSEGRQTADLLAQSFLLPLIDMGVSIPTRRRPDGSPAVAEVLGRIDYVQPGGSSLATREVYTPASLRAEYLRRVSPEAYAAELAEGYIKGVAEEAPAVISLNMRAASAAIVEYIARAFPFRHDANAAYARTLFRLAEGEEETFAESEFPRGVDDLVGRGGAEPLLGLPSLGVTG